MDVRQLEYFVAVAEELSFTRAAARCHVVQSALSYQIARLERENGVALFERTSRSVRLAPAGELLLPRARAVLAELERPRAELAELAGVITGRLRLGMIGSAGQAAPAVERALAAFHHRHPGVEITISDTGSRHMAEQVRSGELDIAFVGLFADQVPADLVHRLLADEPLVVAVAAATRWPAAPADLAELAARSPFVEMRAESGLRQQVDAAFARGRGHPAHRLRARHVRRRGPVRRPGLRAGRRPALGRGRPAATASGAGARRSGGPAPDRPGPPSSRAVGAGARAFLAVLGPVPA